MTNILTLLLIKLCCMVLKPLHLDRHSTFKCDIPLLVCLHSLRMLPFLIYV